MKFFYFFLLLYLTNQLSDIELKQRLLNNFNIIHSALLTQKQKFLQENNTNTNDSSINFLELSDKIKEKEISESEMIKSPEYIICSEIKKEGKQHQFCEEKFLKSRGEKAVVGCFTSFCEICCEPFNDGCLPLCHKTHLETKNVEDPEELFANVCSTQSMIKSMKPFCKKFYNKNPTMLKLCQNSFCYDCCVSELKINDESDREIVKCSNNCLKSMRNSSFSVKKEVKILDNKIVKKKILLENQNYNNETKCRKNEKRNYCEKKVDSKSYDFRIQSKENCINYFCPLCCSDFSSVGYI